MRVTVMGMMGAGKTTVGALVAQQLDAELLDSDALIEERYGRSGGSIAEESGVTTLHRIEREVVELALDFEGDVVIAPAASVIEQDGLRRRIKDTTMPIFLDLPIEATMQRIPAGDHRRSVDPEELKVLSRRREPLFKAIAELTLDATRPPDVLADRIVRAARETNATR